MRDRVPAGGTRRAMAPDPEPLETRAGADIPLCPRRSSARGGRSSKSPTQRSSPVRFCPAPPPGDESWLDWAQRLWPSLAQSLNERLPERSRSAGVASVPVHQPLAARVVTTPGIQTRGRPQGCPVPPQPLQRPEPWHSRHPLAGPRSWAGLVHQPVPLHMSHLSRGPSLLQHRGHVPYVTGIDRVHSTLSGSDTRRRGQCRERANSVEAWPCAVAGTASYTLRGPSRVGRLG